MVDGAQFHAIFAAVYELLTDNDLEQGDKLSVNFAVLGAGRGETVTLEVDNTIKMGAQLFKQQFTMAVEMMAAMQKGAPDA